MTEFGKKLRSVVLWSMIAAAFIGPGTVTTASLAGANHQYSLIWALAYATIICLVLQEACARISIVSEKELPEALLFVAGKNKGMAGLTYLVGISVVLGCIAYQAGNMTGAMSGILLFENLNTKIILSLLFILIFVLLFSGNYQNIARFLSILVAVMGFSFLYIVFKGDHQWTTIGSGFVPTIPEGSGLVFIGLVGTTIVPYNLFLGAGIVKGQSINLMRFGLFVSVVLGGLISIAILISGTMVSGEFSFSAFASSLDPYMNNSGAILLGLGLFAAGFTSSVTSPMAAAILAKGFLGSKQANVYRITWMTVLTFGFLFSMLELKPVYLIVLAQALNGMILPLASILIWVCINHPAIMGTKLPGKTYNTLFFVVQTTISTIGASGLSNVIEKNFDISLPTPTIFILAIMISVAGVFVISKIRKQQV